MDVKRPLLHYHGGKWRIAPWILSFFPAHRTYAELFGGGGSILLRKTRAHEEIYNDIDGDIVNLFRVARDRGEELKGLIELTPYSREEFVLAYCAADDPVEQARRTIVRAFMGHSACGATGAMDNDKTSTGFRAMSDRAGVTAARVWAKYADAFDAIIKRLQGVVIENRDYLAVLKQQDAAGALFYADPPYPLSTRDAGTDYRYEMSDDDHIRLAESLYHTNGAAIVSGYPCALYDDLYKGWTRREKQTVAGGAAKRMEILWMKGVDKGLFEGGD
jgi:DNA adenine methylase